MYARKRALTKNKTKTNQNKRKFCVCMSEACVCVGRALFLVSGSSKNFENFPISLVISIKQSNASELE